MTMHYMYCTWQCTLFIVHDNVLYVLYMTMYFMYFTWQCTMCIVHDNVLNVLYMTMYNYCTLQCTISIVLNYNVLCIVHYNVLYVLYMTMCYVLYRRYFLNSFSGPEVLGETNKIK